MENWDRPVFCYTWSRLPWRKPIIETQWTDSLEIYQKWYSAVNEKAMASPLPIHHQWCIADKLPGSNKLLLRGWPRWWKRKLPHGHPSTHSPLFSIQQSELVSVQGNSYQHYYFLGVVCVRTARRDQTHNLSPDKGWKVPLLDVSAWRWSQKAVLTLCGWCGSSLTCTSPVQIAPAFIPHRQW